MKLNLYQGNPPKTNLGKVVKDLEPGIYKSDEDYYVKYYSKNGNYSVMLCIAGKLDEGTKYETEEKFPEDLERMPPVSLLN